MVWEARGVEASTELPRIRGKYGALETQLAMLMGFDNPVLQTILLVEGLKQNWSKFVPGWDPGLSQKILCGV